MSDEIARDAEAEVRRCVEGYRDALWNYVTNGVRVDHDKLGFWRFPVLMVSGTINECRVNICDAETFDERIRSSYQGYFRNGWDGRVKVDFARATIAGDKIAVVENTGSRYRVDDSINSSWSCLYLLQKTAQGWKHIGMDSAVPLRNPGDWGDWLASIPSASTEGV